MTAGLLLLALAACSARPFVVGAPEVLAPQLSAEQAAAGKTGHPAPRLLSLYYSHTLNTLEEIMAEARYECAEGDVRSSQNCPVLLVIMTREGDHDR